MEQAAVQQLELQNKQLVNAKLQAEIAKIASEAQARGRAG
jgi:hypothetical protein